MKICKECGKEYDRAYKKHTCKKCYFKEYRKINAKRLNEKKKLRRKLNPQYKITVGKYRQKNKERMKEYNKKYHKEYYEKTKDEKKEYYEKTKHLFKERVRQYHKEYYEKNKKELRKQGNEYHKKRILIDPYYRMVTNLRTRKWDYHRKIMKKYHIKDLLNTDEQTFLNHFESLFTEGMSWNNYGGKTGWHIDHVVPETYFDLNDEEQVRICWHYLNLQPLWAEDNRRKWKHLPTNYLEIIETIKKDLSKNKESLH